jgi:hypothetical protein
MFTFGAILLTTLLVWYAHRMNERDRSMYDDDSISLLLLHVRQDLKLVAFLLGGAIVMLGIIADRLH